MPPPVWNAGFSRHSGPEGRGRFVVTAGALVRSRAISANEVHPAARLRRAVLAPGCVVHARAGFQRVTSEHYVHRLEELRKRRLLPVGRTVADAFVQVSLLSDSALGEAIARGLGSGDPGRVRAARGELSDLGYIWEPGPVPRWEPGIPRLMDFAREHVPAD